MSVVGKRYFAVVWPARMVLRSLVISNAGGPIIEKGKWVGFALDYYAEDEKRLRKAYGKAIIGDYATLSEAAGRLTAALRDAA